MATKDLTFSPGDAILFMPGYERKPPYRNGKFVHYTGRKDQHGTIVTVHLTGDPFEICTYEHQLKAAEKESTQMPTSTKTKPKAKDLRRQAKALGIEGWEDMSLDELIEAVDEAQEDEDAAPAKSKSKSKTAKKSAAPVDDDEDDEDDDEDEDDEDDDDEDEDEDDSDEDSDDDEDTDDEDDDEEDDVPATKSKSKKAVAKKAPAKKSTTKPAAKKAASKAPATKAKSTAKKAAPAPREREIAENGNPYPEGSNLHYITELLIKGGKLGVIVKKVNSKLEIKERSVSRDEDETFKEWHRRVVIVTQKLRNDFGFEMEKDGRGLDATIKMVAP